MDQQQDMSNAIKDDTLPEEWDEFGDDRSWAWQFGDETEAR